MTKKVNWDRSHKHLWTRRITKWRAILMYDCLITAEPCDVTLWMSITVKLGLAGLFLSAFLWLFPVHLNWTAADVSLSQHLQLAALSNEWHDYTPDQECVLWKTWNAGWTVYTSSVVQTPYNPNGWIYVSCFHLYVHFLILATVPPSQATQYCNAMQTFSQRTQCYF